MAEASTDLDDGIAKRNRVAALLIPPLVLVLSAVLIVFYVVYDTARVDGDSMEPTLAHAEHLLVTDGYGEPRRGDIVLLTLEWKGRSSDSLKRVVGLPGDEIHIQGDVVLVNGDPAGGAAVIGSSDLAVQPFLVPAHEVFVLGDNRPVSLDSRFAGTVPLSDVQGRVVWRYAPIQRFGSVDGD